VCARACVCVYVCVGVGVETFIQMACDMISIRCDIMCVHVRVYG